MVYEDKSREDLLRMVREKDIKIETLKKIIEDLDYKVNTDRLTGVYNHHYLMSILPIEISNSHREGETLSLVEVDIDDFKRFNDKHGKLVGDEVLKKVAKTIKANLNRDLDIVARYSGGADEFFIIFPGTEANEAQKLCRKIQDKISKIKSIEVLGRRYEVEISVSIGIAPYSFFPEDPKKRRTVKRFNRDKEAKVLIEKTNRALKCAKDIKGVISIY